MNRVILIFPQDTTIEFLREFISILQNKYPESISLIEPDLNCSFEALFKQINSLYKENDIIFFLGHGKSNALYGATNSKEKNILISINQISEVFNGKNVILFSCNSRDIFRKTGVGIKKYLGFGSMPTDWDEIQSERNIGDANYLFNLTSDSLEKFKKILVAGLVSASEKLINEPNFSREMYLVLRMELNKAMLKIPQDTSLPLNERIELFKIIQMTKDDILYK